jgi:hypothetical protein
LWFLFNLPHTKTLIYTKARDSAFFSLYFSISFSSSPCFSLSIFLYTLYLSM